MKIKFLTIILISIITFASSSLLLNDKKIDKELYSTIINSSISNLSSIFKMNTKDIIKKLNENSIRIINEKETIMQIALANSKNSNEIIKIILSH